MIPDGLGWDLLFPPVAFWPELSPSIQAFVRVAYSVLMIGTLLQALPQGHRFFLSERWGGYAQSSRWVDVLQNPVAYPVMMALWFASMLSLGLGVGTVWAALVNLLLCRYYFIWMRWRGVARGLGAPGFMSYWLANVVFLLELTLLHAPDLRSLALLVVQADIACIMLSAGVYKVTAGYPRNHGLELGLVNPQWGYWWRFYKGLSPEHWLIKTMNQLAWFSEVFAGLFMLIPSTRFIGSLLMIGSFAFVRTQIRLGLLCEMVFLAGIPFFAPGTAGDRILSAVVPASWSATPTPAPLPPSVEFLLASALWGYLVLLPLAHAGLSYNFYGQRTLPRPLQRALEWYTNVFGIIVWRVFSVNLINFFALICRQQRDTGERVLLSRYGWRHGLRYSHVCESITVTSLFTTLKYYPGNEKLFEARVLRYARTVPCPPDSVLIFEYHSVRKEAGRFEFVPIAEYTADLAAGTVTERMLDPSESVRAAHPTSSIHEGAHPGSYAPARS